MSAPIYCKPLGFVFKPTVTSCPGCGRTDSDYFIHLARDVNDHIANKSNEWRPAGVESLKIAVMGCVVNSLVKVNMRI